MRSFRRVLAASVAAAAVVGGLSTPASADPSNGEGCAGLPTVPNAYVCLISLTPTEALPSTSTGGIPVSVPPVCYVAGCTSPTTVTVPVPGAQPGSGTVAVIWHGGTYYPIGLGIGGSVFPIVQGAIDLAVFVLGAAGPVVAEVNAIVDNLPTSDEIIEALAPVIRDNVGPWLDFVRDLLDSLDDLGCAGSICP